MTTQYNVDKYVQGINGFGLLFGTQIYTTTLGAGVEATIAVPANAAMGSPSANQKNKFIAVISCEQAKKVYASVNSTAAVPVGAAFAASTSELLQPLTGRYVKTGDTIHFISAAAADVSVSFYSIQD